MGRYEYDLTPTPPTVDVGYSGNLLDPLEVSINKALGSFGAIPPYFLRKQKDVITKVENPYDIRQGLSAAGVLHSVMPLRVRSRDSVAWFTLPIEPLVSISGKNTIIRRNVAKGAEKGTVKERWNRDDYEVTIQGVLTWGDEGAYPKYYVKNIIDLFEEQQSIEINQDVLAVCGIKYLAIESANFPHTKGLNNQNFEIKGYSDNATNLLIPI